jgi:hypothetical protein
MQLPSLLCIIDRTLASILDDYISICIPRVPGLYFGARPRTQTMDIGHACILGVEKGVDSKEGVAIAQTDVKSYSDSLPILLILARLTARGFDIGTVAAIARVQLVVPVHLCTQWSHACISTRTRGGLTGSVLAMTMSRIPIEDSLTQNVQQLTVYGPQVHSSLRLCASSWLENLYFREALASSATAMAHLVACFLRDEWQLAIKVGSREVMCASGGIVDNLVGEGWKTFSCMRVLGWEDFDDSSSTKAR